MKRFVAWATPSLHTRISLVLTGLAATLLLILAGLWLEGSRASIREEVEAASRVSEQWLTAIVREMRNIDPDRAPLHVLALLEPVGRVRANALEVVNAAGRRLYVSPPSAYKVGRSSPAWFAALVQPSFEPRRIEAGPVTLVLRPDASRAVLDAWDDLYAMAGWAASLLVLLFVLTRWALDKALRPLGQVMTALDQTGSGRFDTRLPVYQVPELARLSRAFNGMADRLAEAVNDNVRLETDRELARRLQSRLEEERRGIARELHDELAQGITAVRALAGAIAQRTGEQPALHSHAQSIVAVTGEMQDEIRNILHRLRPPVSEEVNLGETLGRFLCNWRQQYPAIELHVDLASAPVQLAENVALTVLRIAQEGLTNVVRHAGASRVDFAVCGSDGWLEITLADDGRGLGAGPSAQAGSGLGLAGMRERVAILGGRLVLDNSPLGGVRLVARLPDKNPLPFLEEKT